MNTSSYPSIENLGAGDHLCCLYETEEEHRAVLIPFLRQGLERGEKVLHIVDAHTAATVLGYLRDEGLEVGPFLDRGQLAILTSDEAYVQQGFFDPDTMIALLRAEMERAVAEGYPALRVTGEMTWALRGLPGSERLLEYEDRLNEFFPGRPCLALCQYDRQRFSPEILLEVVWTHPLLIVGREFYDRNFYYLPPHERLSADRPAMTLHRWLENLAAYKQQEETLRKQAALYRVRTAVFQMDQADDLENVVLVLYEAFQDLGVKFDHCCIHVINREKDNFEIYAVADRAILRPRADLATMLRDEPGPVTQWTETAVYQAWKQQQPVYRRDLQREDPYHEGKRLTRHYGKPIRSVVDVPFLGGTLAINSGQPEAFTEEDLETLKSMAEVLTEGYRRYEDLREHQQVAEEICQLNAELEQLLQERTAELETSRQALQQEILQREKEEQDILALTEELGLRTHELMTVNRELDAFSYSVSHDLRAPLRAIDGFSRILVEDYAPQLSPQAHRYLQLVRHNVHQMEQLIADLLTFSRLSRQPLHRQPVAPADMVRQALQSLDREQEGRCVEITLGELPLCQADPNLLKEVFVNLLSNALKFTRARDRAVIAIGCREEGGKQVFFVQDNGVGFDMQYAEKLFEVFQRLHRAEEYEGTGIGLALVQRIIHRHGGHIWAKAEVDQGATFFFTLGERSLL